jgi:hypothetical protein
MENKIELKTNQKGHKVLVVDNLSEFLNTRPNTNKGNIVYVTYNPEGYSTASCPAEGWVYYVVQKYGPYNCASCKAQKVITELCIPSPRGFYKHSYCCPICGQDLNKDEGPL